MGQNQAGQPVGEAFKPKVRRSTQGSAVSGSSRPSTMGMGGSQRQNVSGSGAADQTQLSLRGSVSTQANSDAKEIMLWLPGENSPMKNVHEYDPCPESEDVKRLNYCYEHRDFPFDKRWAKQRSLGGVYLSFLAGEDTCDVVPLEENETEQDFQNALYRANQTSAAIESTDTLTELLELGPAKNLRFMDALKPYDMFPALQENLANLHKNVEVGRQYESFLIKNVLNFVDVFLLTNPGASPKETYRAFMEYNKFDASPVDQINDFDWKTSVGGFRAGFARQQKAATTRLLPTQFSDFLRDFTGVICGDTCGHYTVTETRQWREMENFSNLAACQTKVEGPDQDVYKFLTRGTKTPGVMFQGGLNPMRTWKVVAAHHPDGPGPFVEDVVKDFFKNLKRDKRK